MLSTRANRKQRVVKPQLCLLNNMPQYDRAGLLDVSLMDEQTLKKTAARLKAAPAPSE